MLETYQKVVIFSVEKSDLGAVENDARSEEMHKTLEDLDIPFKSLIGRYMDTSETSFLIPETYMNSLSSLIFLTYDQDCILELDVDREATIVTGNGHRISQGYFRKTEKLIALTHDSYTYDPATRSYYTCQEVYI